MNETLMRIRSELWQLLEETREGRIDAEEAETLLSILDALLRSVEAEGIAGDRPKETRYRLADEALPDGS